MKKIDVIEGVALSKLCDYSFGDQSGQWGNIYTSFMKNANSSNLEFIDKVFEIKKQRNYMTLFIDNIRLYKREIAEVKPQDLDYVNSLMSENNLLNLCSEISDMKFIIFTNLEDTPIDEFIFDKIPDNVLGVNAVNAVSYGGKVNPIPYGVQRKFTPNDDKIELLINQMEKPEKEINYLLYINHHDESHSDRYNIKQNFYNKSWAKIQTNKVDYQTFLDEVKKSIFVICPRGNAIDCHRNWEILYLRRVPIMKRYPYLEYLYKDFPVLFVDDYSEITENLLEQNFYLYDECKKMDLGRIMLPKFFDSIVEKSIHLNL